MKTDYASLLNPSQFEAVSTSAQHVRIIAGAGSGKTRVLTYRIAYMIEVMGIDPSHILAVTFTNKAAETMKARVAKIVPQAANFLSVSTFHSFCARFLRVECAAIGYPRGFNIFDEDDVEKLIKDIAVERGHKKGDQIVKQTISYIDHKKTKGLYPEDVTISREAFEGEKECLEMYFIYEERKTAMVCLDFDDLILKTNQILVDNPIIRERWARRFTHILVDEYQDTNDVQYKLLKLLTMPSTSITVVGDPDQTIYTWRGANQQIILNFPIEFAPCQDVVLDQNYRSTKNILDRANELIAHNKKRVPKNLFTAEGEGSEVTPKRFNDANEEARWVVNKIVEIAGAQFPVNYRNIAVLYRSSYITRPFEAEFASQGVPYRIYGGLRFYQRKEVKDVLAYFRLLVNDRDDVSFERIINVPKRDIGQSSVAKIKEEAAGAHLSLYSYCKEIHEHPETEVPTKALTQLMILISKMEETKKQLKENLEVYATILQKFISDINYYEYIAEDESVDEDRVGNVNALFDDITHYVSDHPESTFEEYLQNVSLFSAQDDLADGNYVSLMTIHVAKGLEFDNVFIIGLNEGAFPSFRAETEGGRDGVEEERRLAYVAITRAKKNLFMTCNSGYSFVTDSRTAPSQFFKEAGLKFPSDPFSRPSYSSGYSSKPKSRWRTVGFDDDPFFSDGPSFDPFDTPAAPPVKEEPKDNGIAWKVGDRLNHQKFGDGTVVEIISDSIIQVLFDDGQKKALLGSHHMLSKIPGKGASA